MKMKLIMQSGARNTVFGLLLAMLSYTVTNESEAQSTLESVEGEQLLVVIGASYARAWPIESIGGRRVVNRGINGNQSFEMLARFQEDVLDLKPSTVIIWGFINDIFRSEPDNIDQTLERIRLSMAAMYERAASQGIDVIFATEVTIREPKGIVNMFAGIVGRLFGKTSYQSYINDLVVATNHRLKSFAEEHDVLVLDFAAVLADDDGRRQSRYAVDDGSHLSDSAYAALSAYATERLGALTVAVGGPGG
jgi:lysophospholipase L1-like esterase